MIISDTEEIKVGDAVLDQYNNIVNVKEIIKYSEYSEPYDKLFLIKENGNQYNIRELQGKILILPGNFSKHHLQTIIDRAKNII